MESHTRRRVLTVVSAAAVATTGLAGCLGSESSSSRSESATEGPGRNIPDEQAATEPPMLLRRTDADRPPIRLAENSDDEGDSRSWMDDYHPQTTVVDSASLADQLVDDAPDGTDASDDGGDDTDLASFVSETDFDAETLYLETRQVEQCFRLSLCYISWQDNEIRTDYGRVVRPYDEQCTADTNAFESRLFRLPVALNADEITGYGSSTSSSRCDRAESRANESRDNESRDNQSTESRPETNDSTQSPNGSESK